MLCRNPFLGARRADCCPGGGNMVDYIQPGPSELIAVTGIRRMLEDYKSSIDKPSTKARAL